MSQAKEAAYSFEKPTHEMCAIVCQWVGRYLVWYNPLVVKMSTMCVPPFFEVAPARVSLAYRSVAITTNCFLFVAFGGGLRISMAMNLCADLAGKRFKRSFASNC